VRWAEVEVPVFLDKRSEGFKGREVFLVEGAFYVEALGEVIVRKKLIYFDCCLEGAEARED
jgi:hypothetical protein